MSVDAHYLDRHGVTAYMKDVITLLLENRPAFIGPARLSCLTIHEVWNENNS